MNYAVLLQSALVALLRNKMRSVLTVLGITIGIAAVICVVAIGGPTQVEVARNPQQLIRRDRAPGFRQSPAASAAEPKAGRVLRGAIRAAHRADSVRRRARKSDAV